METIKPGIYQHYKGPEKLYEVIGVGRHSETLEEFVVYRALYTSEEFGPNQLWVRPLQNFLRPVEQDGKTIPRFTFIKEKE
ncbi:MAG: DUF1653 domain-containing protein [Candidatus Magasanikbacteria bacterium]